MLRFPETIRRLLLIFLCLAAASRPSAGAQEWAVVEATGLKLREAPTVDSRVLDVLSGQTRAPVVGRTPGWVEVVVDGTTGYLSEDYVRLVPGTSAERKRDLEHRITRSKAEVARIGRREQAVLADWEAVSQRLAKTRVALARLDEERAALRKAIEESDRAVAELEAETGRVSAIASRRLTALYKLDWLGRVRILATAETIHDFVIHENALRRILAADEAILERLHRRRRELEGLLAERARQRERMESSAAELRRCQRSFQEEQARHDRLLADIRDRKALALAAVAELQKAAARLNAKMSRLNPPPAGEGEEARPVFEATPFQARKGLLRMPVNGEIVHFFGPYQNRRFNVTNVRGGIDIRASRGSPIHAVHEGRVLFADWFKGYGNLMIIDHGDAYHTVYAHMEDILKPEGALVRAAEIIATAGDTGSLEGPMLYFEVRHHGKPVDPLAWLKTG